MTSLHVRAGRRGDRGASLLEYGAVLGIVAVLVGGVLLVVPGLSQTISERVSETVCTIFNGEDCGSVTPETETNEEVAAPDGDADADADDIMRLVERLGEITEALGGVSPRQEIREALEATESGRDALDYIDENPIDVNYYAEGCSYSPGGRGINVDPTRGQEHSAGCFVHEVDHYIRDMNGERPVPEDYDDKDEYLQAMAEFEALARIAQIQFHRELREEWGDDVELHFWDDLYDRAYRWGALEAWWEAGEEVTLERLSEAIEQGGQEAALERLAEEYFPNDDRSGHGSYYETWVERWEDAHS